MKILRFHPLPSAVADAKTVSGYYMSSRRAQDILLSFPNSFEDAYVAPELTLEAIGLIGGVGTLVVIFATFRMWSAPNLWKGARWLNLIIMLACIAFTWFVIHWHMINFKHELLKNQPLAVSL